MGPLAGVPTEERAAVFTVFSAERPPGIHVTIPASVVGQDCNLISTADLKRHGWSSLFGDQPMLLDLFGRYTYA